NPGQMNRGTWLKEQALRKARALELAPKEARKLEQLIVSDPAQQEAYRAFVEKYYDEKGPGATIDVGLVQQVLKDDRFKRQGGLPDSDLIIMQDKVLNSKNQAHKGFIFGDSSISKREFLQVPRMLENPDILVWDNKHSQYVIIMHNKRRQLTFLPLEVNRIKAMKGEYWTLRSVYKVGSYNEVFNEMWQGKYRYEMLSPKKKK
ncbi:MAG: hypothetical protein AAF975_08465, partial [Spirochaetota bacterium]